MGLQFTLLLNTCFCMQNVKYNCSVCACPNQWQSYKYNLNVHQLVWVGCRNLFPHFILNPSLSSKLEVTALQTASPRWSLHRAVCGFAVPWYLCLHPVFLQVYSSWSMLPPDSPLTPYPVPEEWLSVCMMPAPWGHCSMKQSFMQVIYEYEVLIICWF